MSRLLVVQYAGDYRQAYWRREKDGTESYHAHGYVLDTMARLAERHGAAGLLCGHCDEPYDEMLPNGVRAIGVPGDPGKASAALTTAIDAFAPTHLVVHGPMTGLLRLVAGREVRVACIFADSFETSWLRRRLRFGNLVGLLNRAQVEWVGNHGRNACLSLARIGVDRGKILPWDFPHRHDPADMPVRAAPDGLPYSLLYVGSLVPSKGVGDLIEAVARLRRDGLDIGARIAGGGDRARFEALARQHGVADDVEFLGLVPNAGIRPMMRAATAVCVPSWHRYPEGLPLTIYEALSTRTPIVASDHPMFAGHLRHGETAMIHRERDPAGLASAVRTVIESPETYRRISEASASVWSGLQIGTKWADLLDHWLADDAASAAWFTTNSLRAS